MEADRPLLKAFGLGMIVGMLMVPPIQWAGAAFGKFLFHAFH
jgi:hypothetical protein